jgi:hypothetical protein
MSEPQVVALMRLLKPDLKDGHWHACGDAEIEFARVCAAADEGKPAPVPAACKDLEEAKKVESGSNGKLYGDLAVAEMTARANNMRKLLKQGVPDTKVRQEYQYKVSALELLIPWRVAEDKKAADLAKKLAKAAEAAGGKPVQ